MEELFECGDPAFERELWRCEDRRLLPFCQRWSRDKRPVARRALLKVALEPPVDGSARLIVKVLFKAAERQRDDVAMAHFMVGFDRWVAREPRQLLHHWDRSLVGERKGAAFSHRTRVYLMRR